MARLPVLGRAPRWRPPDVGPRAAGVVRPVHLRRRHRRLRRGGGGDRLALPHEGLVLLLLLLLVVNGGGVRERGVSRLLLLLLRHRPRQLLVVAVAVVVLVVVGRAATGAAARARSLPLGRRPRDHPRDRLQLLQVRQRLRVPPRVGRGRPGRPRGRRRVILRGRRRRGGFPGEVSLRLRREELRFERGEIVCRSCHRPLALVVNHAHGGGFYIFCGIIAATAAAAVIRHHQQKIALEE